MYRQFAAICVFHCVRQTFMDRCSHHFFKLLLLRYITIKHQFHIYCLRRLRQYLHAISRIMGDRFPLKSRDCKPPKIHQPLSVSIFVRKISPQCQKRAPYIIMNPNFGSQDLSFPGDGIQVLVVFPHFFIDSSQMRISFLHLLIFLILLSNIIRDALLHL